MQPQQQSPNFKRIVNIYSVNNGLGGPMPQI